MSDFLYNLRLVTKSLRRDRWFTLVMVLSQALSVSIFVTALTTAQRYTNTGQVADDVFRVEGDRDNLLARFYAGTQFEVFGNFSANYVSMPTVRTLAATGAAAAATVNFVAVLAGGPADRPLDRLPVRFCDADIFQMLNVDFRYGGPFTRADERASPPVPVVVLSDLLNDKLYGGADSVGRMIRIAGRDFRVAGVTRQRTGRMQLWDYGVPPDHMVNVIVPFVFADQLRPVPWISWPPAPAYAGWRAIADSPSGITEYWVRLPSPEARARFAAALSGVGAQWTLHSADEITQRFSKPPPPYRVFVILTLVLMEVSVINLMRMLLAKATSRAAEIGIHRALGAGRNVIFTRQLLEGVLVSMIGSVLGVALAVPTVAVFDHLIPDLPIRLAVTPTVIGIALLICLLAALVSGIYPAWRVASVAPTRYLGKV